MRQSISKFGEAATTRLSTQQTIDGPFETVRVHGLKLGWLVNDSTCFLKSRLMVGWSVVVGTVRFVSIRPFYRRGDHDMTNKSSRTTSKSRSCGPSKTAEKHQTSDE
jgi:hypothetical protein